MVSRLERLAQLAPLSVDQDVTKPIARCEGPRHDEITLGDEHSAEIPVRALAALAELMVAEAEVLGDARVVRLVDPFRHQYFGYVSVIRSV